MELREYLIEELVKLQERSSRNPLDIHGDNDHVNDWADESNKIEAAREALERLGFVMLDEQLHWPAHNEWTKRIEDGPVLLDGEEAPEPIDHTLLEFTDEEKAHWEQHIDENMVIIDADEGHDYLSELMMELSK